MEKYVSESRAIAFPQAAVWTKLSNLENLATFITPEKLEEARSKGIDTKGFQLEDFSATPDQCSFKISPLGQITIAIVEREPYKLVKLQGDQSLPFLATFWIQLVPDGEEACKLRLTLHAELSMMIKMMIGSYLEKGIDKVAELLAAIDYTT